jgi:hypothetical protein
LASSRRARSVRIAGTAGLIVALALMLRVLTVPVQLSPERVKVPMVAMVLSCLFLGTAPIAASMAIDRPEAIDAALGTSRSAAEDGGRAAFLPREE